MLIIDINTDSEQQRDASVRTQQSGIESRTDRESMDNGETALRRLIDLLRSIFVWLAR